MSDPDIPILKRLGHPLFPFIENMEAQFHLFMKSNKPKQIVCRSSPVTYPLFEVLFMTTLIIVVGILYIAKNELLPDTTLKSALSALKGLFTKKV